MVKEAGARNRLSDLTLNDFATCLFSDTLTSVKWAKCMLTLDEKVCKGWSRKGKHFQEGSNAYEISLH